MTDPVSKPDVPTERPIRPRGFAPPARWVVLGSGAAAVLSAVGVLVFSTGANPTEVVGAQLVPVRPAAAPAAPALPAPGPLVPPVQLNGNGGIFGLITGGDPDVAPEVQPQSADIDTRQADPGPARKVIPPVVPKVAPAVPKPAAQPQPAPVAQPQVPKPQVTQPPAVKPAPQPAAPPPAYPGYPPYPDPYGGYPGWGYGYYGW